MLDVVNLMSRGRNGLSLLTWIESAAVEVWKWINDSIPHFAGNVIYSLILGSKLIYVSKMGLMSI